MAEDPLDKARELGRALADSTEYQSLMECEKSFAGEHEAMDLLKSFERERQKIQNLQALGVEVPPSAIDELEGIQDKIQNNGTIKKLMELQKTYETLLQRVNEEINRALAGASASRLILPGSPEGPG